MAVERDVAGDGDGSASDDWAAGPVAEPPVSLATVLAYTTLAMLLVGWFLFGLLIQGQGLVDSAGESLGTAFTLLLVVSVIGMLRRPED